MRLDPANSHLTEPAAIWMHFVGTVTRADLAAPDGPLNTDDRPLVEWLGALHHTGQRQDRLCIGRRLQAWLAPITERSLQAKSLGEAEMRSIQAGAALFDLTLRLDEGDAAGAATTQAKLKELLSPNLYGLLFGNPRSAPLPSPGN